MLVLIAATRMLNTHTTCQALPYVFTYAERFILRASERSVLLSPFHRELSLLIPGHSMYLSRQIGRQRGHR